MVARARTFREILDRSVDVGLCWTWTGFITPEGYGRTSWHGRRLLAHRLVWAELVGPIPRGLTLDHLCRNRRCVNPDHLEVVTLAENKRRGADGASVNRKKTHCKYGHPFGAESIRADGKGRRCRVCAKERR